ncbi:hypothetical protein GCM10027174_00350 [Salinifilum aidingensis]
MTGYGVDPEALRGAINKLKQTRSRVDTLREDAESLEPGELTAKDNATQLAYKEMKKRAVGEENSLSSHSERLTEKLEAKIQAYEETLKEYEQRDREAFSGWA